MTAVTGAAAVAVATAGLAGLVLAVALTGAWRQGLRLALDLWVAAGLLRLSGDPGLAQVAAAAVVVAVRQVVAAGLRHGAVARVGPRDGRRRPGWPGRRRS